MTPRVLVTVPLCDYESITTQVWHQRTTYYLVRACLKSFARHIRTPITLYLLADRCTDQFVHMAEAALARFNPVTLDNSRLGYDLDRLAMKESHKHSNNQLLKTIELSSDFDFFYYCEQDYLFRCDALDHALAAFAEIPNVNLLTLYDHPDRHRADRESELGRHRYFPTSRSTWKSVSSTNANWIWRTSLVRARSAWLERIIRAGAIDYDITNTLFREGELLLGPVHSLVQHYRLDGSNASPTFGFSLRMALTRPVGRTIAQWRRVSSRLGRLRAGVTAGGRR